LTLRSGCRPPGSAILPLSGGCRARAAAVRVPARRGPALPAARQGFRGARSWHRRIAAGRRGEGRPSFGV